MVDRIVQDPIRLKKPCCFQLKVAPRPIFSHTIKIQYSLYILYSDSFNKCFTGPEVDVLNFLFAIVTIGTEEVLIVWHDRTKMDIRLS